MSGFNWGYKQGAKDSKELGCGGKVQVKGYARGGPVKKSFPKKPPAATAPSKDTPKLAKGGKAPDGHWMQKAFANSHGQFKAKAKAAGMSTKSFANKKSGAGGKTGRQANLALQGMKASRKK